MSLFKKFLIIMLTVALPPLVLVSMLDRRSAESLSLELIRENRDLRLLEAEADLEAFVANAGRLLARERELLEFALREQASKPGVDPALLPSPDGGLILGRSILPLDAGSGERWIVEAASSSSPVWFRRGDILTIAMQSVDAGHVAAIDITLDALADRIVMPDQWAGDVALLLSDAADGSVLIARGPDLARAPEGPAKLIMTSGPAGGFGLMLTLALPSEVVQAEMAEQEARAAKRLEQQMAVGITSVVVFGLIAILLSFIGSRAISRPVVHLTRLARRIADGDLNARAHVATGDELEELAESFNAMIPKLQDRFRMREALSLAMEVQQHLLPTSPPSLDGFDVAGRSLYCDETGGDYYDFIEFSELDSRHIGIAVGDVTGHGVAAALLMTSARALLRSHAGRAGGLSAMMTAINRHLTEDTHAGRFMTLFYGVLEAPDRHFRWVSAGHEPAMLYDPGDGQFQELSGPDIPLGIDGNWQYQEQSRSGWRAGEILVIGTDGIWESRNPEGEMYGKEALMAVVRQYADQPADAICDAITRAVRSFRRDRGQQDDITLVVVKAV